MSELMIIDIFLMAVLRIRILSILQLPIPGLSEISLINPESDVVNSLGFGIMFRKI